jgi:hypothetical protein
MTVMIARREGVFKTPDGSLYRLEVGRTTADADHPIVRSFPDAWAPFAVHFASGEPAPMDESIADQLTELEETAERYRLILTTISDGLEVRGLLASADREREGWLVEAVFSAVDGPEKISEQAGPALATPASADPRTPDGRATIRQWARSSGLEVSDRGALSPGIVKAYQAAHGG